MPFEEASVRESGHPLAPRWFLAGLADRSADETSEFLEYIEANAAEKQTAEIDVSDWFGIIVGEESGIPRLYSREILLSELSCRIGDYSRAFRYLNAHIRKVVKDSQLEIENFDYAWCALAYLKLKAEGSADGETESTLKSLFGDALAAEVAGDIASPEKPLANCVLPRCGDCARCPIERHCLYPEWRRIVECLNRRMAGSSIDQADLVRIFRGAGAKKPS
jgi:hypothetical protein